MVYTDTCYIYYLSLKQIHSVSNNLKQTLCITNQNLPVKIRKLPPKQCVNYAKLFWTHKQVHKGCGYLRVYVLSHKNDLLNSAKKSISKKALLRDVYTFFRTLKSA